MKRTAIRTGKRPSKTSTRAPKYVYFFAAGKAEGSSALRHLLGGKGSELAEMTNLGIPVPPGFTITTQAWAAYHAAGGKHPPDLWSQVVANLARLEGVAGNRLGDAERPLLVSVRSGARASMPGMMDTVLNLGLNDQTVEGLARWTKNERFAWDCYRRFITIFGDVALGIERRAFDELLDRAKANANAKTDADLPAPALRELVAESKQLVQARTGRPFPQEPMEQLRLAINAVFDSWFGKKAVDYRRIHRLPEDWGTAVTVMAMVYGNLGETSGTGVCFSRDPSSGEKRFFGEFLVNAQGEDVVAGVRTPEPVEALRQRMPAVYKRLVGFKDALERHYRDMQDIEFTVQEGRLYILQTRSGKRTAAAAVRIAVEMVREGLFADGEPKPVKRGGNGKDAEGKAERLDKARQTALLRIEPASLHQLLVKTVDPEATYTSIARGLPATPAAAVGKVVFDPEKAVEMALREEPAILVRAETSPEDVAGMHAAQGVLTSRGGLTSHAAVVARGWGKCCVVGAGDVVVDEERHLFRAGRAVVREGQVITLNGATGEVIKGALPLVDPKLSDEFREILGWAQERATTKVRANVDTPADAAKAREFERRGHRARAHRAHVLPRGPHRHRPRDDHGQRGEGPEAGGGSPAALPARGLHRDLHRHGPVPGDDPAARPAAARVPAQVQGSARGLHPARRARHQPGAAPGAGRDQGAARGLGRGQSDARPSRLPPRHHVPGDLRDAGARHHGGGLRGRPARASRRARDHDPAHRHGGGDEAHPGDDGARGRAGADRDGPEGAVFGGHDDRGAPGGAGGRQDRGARGFLLVRHQ